MADKGRHILGQAWKALALHRLRSFLSALGIVFAVAAVVTMLAIAEGAKKQALEQIGRLGIDAIIIRNAAAETAADDGASAFSPPGLGHQDALLLRRLPGVERVTVVRDIKATLAELKAVDVTGVLAVNPDYAAARGLRTAKGRFFTETDIRNSHQVCVLGSEVSRRLGPAGDPGAMIHLSGDPYRVIGVLRARGRLDGKALPLALRDFDNVVLIPLEATAGVSAPVGAAEDLSEIILKIADVRRIGAVSRTVRHVLRRNRNGVENFELIVPKELLAQARQTQRLFNIVLGSIAGISLLVGGIGIMNIMLANVSERTREIGIRRAIGASRRHIIFHFLGEAILLTVVGGVLGVALGSLAAVGVNLFIQWRASITLWSVLSALAMSVAVGMISGLYPAVKAAQMEPAAALRHM
jgi:putative ABC transport system permease protein